METPARSLGPLDGVQVVVTRPEGDEGPLSRRLAERGATVLHWPVVRFEPPEDTDPLDDALGRLESYDGIVFTSPRAVEAVTRRVRQPTGRPWVAAIGEATRRTLEAAGWRVDRIPRQASSEALVRELGDLGCAELRVLFPASSLAREELSRGLGRRGATVDRVTAYRTIPNEALEVGSCLAALGEAPLTIITFASPSAVSGLLALLGEASFERLLSSCPAVAIGPTTAAALEEVGVRPARVAGERSMAGLAEAAALAAIRPEEV